MSDLDSSQLTPEERARLAELEERMKEWNQRQLAAAPLHVRVLGRVIRRSVATGSLTSFRRFLKKHGLLTPRIDHQLVVYRDYLIINRVDLKDLEPAARERLRLRTLKRDDLSQATPDYQRAHAQGQELRCRDCRFFMTAPADGDGENADKSCVELGTKGADRACAGFTWPMN